MNRINYLKLVIATIPLTVAAFTPVVRAEGQPNPIPTVAENQWRGSVTPYMWLMNVSGAVARNGDTLGSVHLDTNSLLSNLNVAAMIEGEVHRGNWGLWGDLVYSQLSNQSSRLSVGQTTLNTTTTLTTGIYDIAATYTLHASPGAYVDGLVGARILTQDTTVNLSTVGLLPNGVNRNSSTTITNAIVGVKGRVQISDSTWFVPFYLDVGAGSAQTNVTSQAMLGIGKAYSWGDVSLAVKNVYYQLSQNKQTADLNIFGAALAVTFRF
mgnify:FL=1